MAASHSEDPPRRQSTVATEPLLPEESPEAGGPAPDPGRLRALLLAILHQMDWDLGDEFRPELARLKHRLERADDWPELWAVGHQLGGVLASFTSLLVAEREDLARFISEVARRLSEVEDHLKSTAKGAAKFHGQNQDFASQMMGGLADFQRDAEAAADLKDIKSVVLNRLDAFRSMVQDNRSLQSRHLKQVSSELEQMRDRFGQVQEELGRMEEENQQLAARLRTDPLTGAHNRLALEERLAQEMGLVRRGQRGFSVLMVDLDHFKRINDTHGHPVGDQCLVEVVAKLNKGLRVSDLLARYGGEEFAVVLPAIAAGEALKAAEKLRRLVAETEFTVKGRQIPVTVSIGATEAQAMDQGPQDVLQRADQALYQAKDNGRNQVCLV